MRDANGSLSLGQKDVAEEEEDDMGEDELPSPVLPPDGGWGWMVVAASMLSNIIVDGVCFTYGIFFIEFLNEYGASRGKTAFVGSLIPGLYLGMGPIASALANKFGFRWVTIVGSLIAASSFFVSTYSPSINWLIFTYGVMGGFGFGLMYLPAIVIVNFYFDKRRALATGLAVSGTGIGTMVFAPLGRYLLDNYGWKGSFVIISAIILNGVVCGAVFRPLEQNRVPKRKTEAKEMKLPPNIIMQRIIEEKNRQRTISTGSLDGTVITKDNTLIKDPKELKKLYLEILQAEEANKRSRASLQGPGGPVGDQGLGDRAGSYSIVGSNGWKKEMQRIRSEQSVGKQQRTRTISEGHDNERRPSVTWDKGSTGTTDFTSRDKCSMGATDFTSRASIASRKSIKRDLNRPMYRKDIFYSGSVANIAEYQSSADMGMYVASITSIPAQPAETMGPCRSRLAPILNVLKEIFDFSLLSSITFVVVCTCSILAMIGFFTPFVYMTPKAMQMGYSADKATLLITVLGVSNTLGRVAAGWISDRSWADCLLIHNAALIAGGVATCFVPMFTSYAMLNVYCVIFGLCIACFISLRSIVLVELLGIEKLTNSFGLLLLFQGMASLIGTPLAGMIYDMTRSYTASFIASGILIALAGLICLPIRRIAAWEKRRQHPHLYDAAPQADSEDGLPLSKEMVTMNVDVETNM